MRVYAIEQQIGFFFRTAKEIQKIFKTTTQAREYLRLLAEEVQQNGYKIIERGKDSFLYQSEHSSEQGQFKIKFLGTL